MLCKRLIPCLDVRDGRVVKGVRFVNLRDAGDPVEAAQAYDQQGADELVFLDITASHEGRAIMLEGGGGADKVSLNTAALARPELVREAARAFGSQCIVVAIDAKREPSDNGAPPHWTVFTHGGRRPTGREALRWAREVEALGAGELLLTSMHRH